VGRASDPLRDGRRDERRDFTDGVDGLAAGVCTIAAVTFAVIALSLDRVEAGVLAAAVGGAC